MAEEGPTRFLTSKLDLIPNIYSDTIKKTMLPSIWWYILRSSSWNGSIDLAAFFKSQFYLSQLERLRPIHMNTMEFHSVVAKSIFGAKLSNVNKPISRISDVIFLAETYQPSWNLFWYVSRAGTIWCQTNVQNLKGMIMKGWPRR